jgi:uncharacterized membrane protein
MKTNRIEAFSDGVIAILITIMVLELKAPHDPTPGSLAKMWPVFFAYVLSFIIIAIYWVNHHHLIHLVTRVDSVILWANINLLFWISLIPWVTVYLGDNHALPFPVALYAAVSTAGAISFFFLRVSIARHHHEPEFKRLNKKWPAKTSSPFLSISRPSPQHSSPRRSRWSWLRCRQRCISCPNAGSKNSSTKERDATLPSLWQRLELNFARRSRWD